ncbi:MAG TPA: ABC transporter transmembrane domain-containing protein [Kofleriaceae bacterium]|nr:ABC transporter transmembrane domain-containing protein [Kofleriaceae bacterium]
MPGAPPSTPGGRRASRARGATVRRLLRLARPEAGLLAAGLLFLFIGSAATLLYPQGVRVVIDAALGTPPPWAAGADRARLLEWVAIAMAAIAAVSAIAMGLRYYLFVLAGERVIARLRVDLYRAITAQEIGFFDRERTGDLMSRLSSDTATLQGSVSANISYGLRNTIQLVGGVALLIYTSPRLALLILAIVPPIAVGAVVYGRRIRRLSRKVQDALAQGQSVAEESIAGIRTVRSFAAEEAEAIRYGGAITRALGLARRRIRASALFMSATSFAGYAAAALVFWYGGRLVQAGELSAGDLTSFLVYTLLVGFSLGALADLWADFLRSLGAAERVFELLDRTPELPRTGGRSLDHLEGSLEIDRVEFRYPTRPDVPVLGGLSLRVAPGEVVALVGPSGAGKSTIAALLLRLYDPDAGVIRLDGVPLPELDPEWLRRRIGLVAQEPILFSTSVAENIRYGRPDASRDEIEAAARAANADDFIRRFPDGYDTLVGERGVQLSGGQKQRVAIARAVLVDPRILVLDEATSALDAESEHLVKEALDRLMQGRTTLIIAHRLSTVRDADRVLVVDGGRIIESGRHEDLVARDGLYRRLVERQFATG